MALNRTSLRNRRKGALFALAAALIASLALGLLFVARKPADTDQAWPPSPQPMRIDMPRDSRIAAERPHAVAPLLLARGGEAR
jgi:hypothetical protein